MKKAAKNIVSGWITTLIGTATMIITLFLVYKGTITFIWEGIGGLIVGCLLLVAPQTVEKKISEAISAFSKNNNQQPNI